MSARIDVPGISSDYLVEPSYVRARGWAMYAIPDRLTDRQLRVLLGPVRARSTKIYGAHEAGGHRQIVALERSPDAILAYFVEMVGGDVCVFDLPNSFLVCVLPGDITITAAAPEKIARCFGSTEMTAQAWIELVAPVIHGIKKRLTEKYSLSL